MFRTFYFEPFSFDDIEALRSSLPDGEFVRVSVWQERADEPYARLTLRTLSLDSLRESMSRAHLEKSVLESAKLVDEPAQESESIEERDALEWAVMHGKKCTFENFRNGNAADLIERFENCDDIAPGTLCDELDLPRGSTFGRCVRDIRRFLDRQSLSEPSPA